MDDLYFTWPDRGLAYDCRGCGACCKGLGIGVDASGGQLRELLHRYPPLIPFVRKRGSAWTIFNPRGRCWFLDDAGLCAVERDHGREAKPASCRLFPFNRVFVLGRHTIVDYNSVVCPLTRVAADGVTHADIAREIGTIDDPAVVGTRLPLDADDPDGDTFVARERAVAEACFGATTTGAWDACWQPSAATVPHIDAFRAIERALATLTGMPGFVPIGDTLANALVLTPSLRFNELYGPRQYASRSEMIRVLPHMWMAWLAFAGHGANLAGRDLGLQELTTLWGEMALVSYVLARWRERPRLAPGPVQLPTGADPDGVVRRFGEACVRNKKRLLGDIWMHSVGDRAAEETIALLKLAEPLLKKLTFV